MKRHFHTTVAITLMLLLSAGQLPFLAASRERIVRPEPPKPARRSKKQDPAPQPRPAGESVTQLPDGRTLHLGGDSPDGPTTAAEIRDERTGAVTRLSESFRYARVWHTATVLPDGHVFIFGGIGSNGQVQSRPELFDPETNSFQVLPANGLSARAYHTATLLTDGRLLLAGGIDVNSKSSNKLETWDHENKTARVLNTQLKSGRRKAQASLQADGTVFISSGSDETEATVAGSEIYDPANNVLTWVPVSSPSAEDATARIVFSSPADGTLDVDPKTRIAIRFSQRLQSDSINRGTVKLSGPSGDVPSRIVSAENGRIVFVTPLAPLAPDSSYNVTLDGAVTANKQKLEFASFSFKTIAREDCAPGQPCADDTPPIFDADTWTPSERGNWNSGRKEVTPDLPSLQAAEGDTALAGRVFALSGNPLARVTLQVGERTAVTDSTGRFLLSGIPSGRQVLTIQGHTAGRPGKQYGTFDVLVDVVAGKTTALDYKIWLPVLDEKNAVSLPIPTNRELGVTTPHIPGMEVRIPASSVLRMPAGAHHSHGLTRRELTSVAITPIPVDRTPFPLPQGVNEALVFTLQLHGAHVEGLNGEKRPGMRIVYPNYLNLPAGDRVEFWNYEPAGNGWYMYGRGTVTPDRRQVIPDAGVELQNMHCASFMNKNDGTPGKYPADNGREAGEPVDLGTGLFVYHKTDLVLPDVIPLALTRTYRQDDSIERSFGKGMTNPYDIYMWGNTATFGEIVLPDAGRVHFDVVTQAPYTYVCNNSPTRFYKATMAMIPGVGPNGAWEVRLKDGSIYQFGIKAIFGDIFGVHSSITALFSYQDRFGNKFTISRDENFRMTRVTSPNGRWIQFTYSDTSKKIAQATDNTGRTVSYTYDANGRLWKVTDAKGGVTEYLYDASDRMLSIKDPRNIVYLTNEYDPASGRVTRQTQSDNSVYQYAYTVDAQGKVTQTDVTDPRNYVHRATFNSAGYVASETFALGTPQQQTYTYQRQAGSNLLQSVTDPLGRQTSLGFDSLGNVTSVTRLAGTQNAVTTNFHYEPAFNQIDELTDPLNHTTSFSYDALGRLNSRTDPLDHTTTYTYNSSGQLLTLEDPLDHKIELTYDSGDLVTIKDPLNRTVKRYFDAAGRLLRVTSALGAVSRYEYDALNMPTRGVDPAQGATDFTYDPNGNLLSVTDSQTGATSYTYDAMDRMTKRRDHLLREIIYEYNGLGNLTQITDRKNQTTQYTYDPLNRLTQVSYADGSTISYTYDAGNRITQISDSVSGILSYEYDGLDRLTSETTPYGTVTYTYDNADRRTTMTVQGQPAVNYTYDDANRLTQVSQGSNNVTIGYDDADRRTSLTLPSNLTVEYEYDAAYQLLSLTYKRSGNVIGNLTYEYDAEGKRTQMAGTLARTISPQSTSSATYNLLNQQLTFGSSTLTYDANGSLTNDGENVYTWDARNRLISVSGPSVEASFEYDATGRRSRKTINGITTNFLYDGANVVQEQSAQLGNANLLNGGLDEVFARVNSNGALSPLVDGQGSTISLQDWTGTQETDYTYDPFGLTANAGSANDNSSQYTGRENDATGLYFYRARYYSPNLKRFISEDPLGLSAGINLYAYVENRVPNAKDPYGKDLFGITGGGSAGAGAGAASVMGTAGYLIGMNTNCKCRDWFSSGGAGTVGLSAGHEYGYPANQSESAGLGATAGAGGGLFWSNAPSYESLNGEFDTTIISTPFGVGFEIDTAGDTVIASLTYGKGWGAGVFHFKTNTPSWSTWDTKCYRHHPIVV